VSDLQEQGRRFPDQDEPPVCELQFLFRTDLLQRAGVNATTKKVNETRRRLTFLATPEESVKLSDQINPALKSWIDNVVVPALVKAYIADVERKNGIASASEPGIESPFDVHPLPEGPS
jgi:hypothetical protein